MLQGASKVIIGQIFTRLSQRVSGQAISTGWWARLRASLGALFGKGGAQ
jgi:2-furoyl-CoA dehydrogenase large subunit